MPKIYLSPSTQESNPYITGSGSEVHNAVNARQHIAGFPARHCHVVHGFGSLGSGELASLISFMMRIA